MFLKSEAEFLKQENAMTSKNWKHKLWCMV